MRRLISSLFIVLTICVSCVEAKDKPVEENAMGLCLVMNFDDGIVNRLGGYYNKFERPPSTASTFLASDVHRGQGGRSLRVATDRRDEGFCGVWMHFFNFRAGASKRYFDASGYEYLSFWVKGQKGGEDFTIKLADEDWVVQEDGLPVGSVGEFLPGGVTTEWKEVLVPLKRFNTLELTKMAGITLDFDAIGKFVVYIDDFCFKTSAQAPTPLTPASEAVSVANQTHPRAMWVWSTEQLLNDDAARQSLFAFCKQENINQLWLQILYRFEPDVAVSQVAVDGRLPETLRCVLQHADAFRQFLEQAHKEDIFVHALDGYPEYAQKIYHAMPLAIVDAIIAFNKESKPAQRFDGIHFDNEPYLIAGWRDPTRSKEILKEFLHLNAQCQKRVREQSEMVFGVDIPFFWHERDPKTGQIIGEVSFNGQVKPASYHCIDMLDNVGIMNYRDTADGADGMIAHGQELLEYGDTVSNAKIYMGIETFSYPPTDCWFALGLPKDVFARVIEKQDGALSRLSRIDGFRTQIFDDGSNIHLGIELPANPTPQQKEQAKKAVMKIAKHLGVLSVPELKSRLKEIAVAAFEGFSYDVEWKNPQDRVIFDTVTGAKFPGLVATSIMLPKVSFSQESYGQIQAQTRAAESVFNRYNSYRGIAIHYYQTYRSKVETDR